MKRLALLVVIAGLGWSTWWFSQAQSLRGGVEAWFDARRAEGWEASYDTLSVRGFPNRLDVTFKDLVLADPDSRRVWEAPFFQVFMLVYDRDHQIFVWPSEQRLSGPGGETTIGSDGLRASLVRDDAGTILRANLEAKILNIAGPDQNVALAGLTAALQQVQTQPRAYRVAVDADAVAGATGALTRLGTETLDGLRLDAVLRFDRAWSVGALEGTRPQPERLELRLAEYRAGPIRLKAAGTLDIDARGRLDGELALKADNWRDLIALARESGRLPEGVARAVEDGLALIAGLSGNRETLDLPLTFRRGRMALGPVPLGEAPRLRLP